MRMDREQWWNDTNGGKSKYSQKIIFNAPLFTTNLPWADMGKNSGLRGEVDDYSPEPWHYIES